MKEIYGSNDINKVPLMSGYRYTGKDENGNSLWKETPPISLSIDESKFGLDDGVTAIYNGDMPISETDEIGARGEKIYTVSTVYTEIKIDGERDAAYDYGVHLKGFVARDPEYYANRSTSIEVWMIRSQDGMLCVYGEITDPDLVNNDELRDFKPHYCDCLHPYVDFGNVGALYYPAIAASIIPTTGGKADTVFPKRPYAFKITETGYKFEYSIDNKGKPFMEGDELGFNFYYNDTNDYVSLENYQHSLGCIPTDLMGGKYVAPDAKYFDALRFSEASAVRNTASKAAPAEKTGDLIKDILSGASTLCVTCGKNAMAQSVICMKSITNMLIAKGARVLRHIEGGMNEKPKCDSEILIDFTSSTESLALADKLEYNEYGISISENKISLMGYRQNALEKARDMLFSAIEYVAAGGNTCDLDSFYKAEDESCVKIPKMHKVSLVSDAGDGAYQPLLLDADKSDFDAYLSKLLSKGYRVYTENTMASVKTVTLVGGDSVVTLSYGSNDRSLRAVAEPLSGTSLPPLERENYTPVCPSFIAQLGAEKVYLMCYIIKLDNGEFLVIDSGSNGCSQYVFDRLMELNNGKDAVIANWMFTHFHIDHVGGFVNFVANDEFMRHVKIKSVTYNFPQKQVLDTAPGAGDINNIKAWKSTVEKTGARVYQARTGQKYYFGGAEIEMIFTYEDLMPFNIFGDRTNPTSSICSIKINGQRFIIMGDACGEASTLCALRYGDWLKSDYVQLSHHGMGDGGTDVNFYKAIDAPYVLYPGRVYRPSPAEKWACENSKEYFLNPEDTTVIALPYGGEKEKVKII